LAILALFFNAPKNGLAQETYIPNTSLEETLIFTDRDLYINGENIMFSIFCHSNGTLEPSLLSKVIYLELFNGNKKSLVQKKYRINEGVAQGFIKIPTELQSGIYYVRAYTKYQRNFNTDLYSVKPVMIINPEVPLSKPDLSNTKNNAADSVSDISISIKNQNLRNYISVKTDKEVYGQGQLVNLEILLSDTLSGILAKAFITVAKKGTISKVQSNYIMSHYTDNDQMQNISSNDQIPITHIPEIRNFSLSGIVRNKNTNTPVAGSQVLLSHVSNAPLVQVYETRQDGRFLFSLNTTGQKQDLFLCTLDKNPDLEILVNTDFEPEYPEMINLPLEIDTSDKSLLEELYLNRQLQEILEEIRDEQMEAEEVNSVFGEPEISIQLDDYIDLPSMYVILNEIVPYVKVRKKKGNHRLTILDSETGLTYENHLVLVDNLPINDINELMRIHPSKVVQVDVINRTYVLGDYRFHGILMIKTRTDNFGGVSLPPDAVFLEYQMVTPTQHAESHNPVSGLELQIGSLKEPDFRTTLYWNPHVTIDQKTRFSFYTSHHCSEYEIVVEGITANGLKVSGQSSFVVKPIKQF